MEWLRRHLRDPHLAENFDGVLSRAFSAPVWPFVMMLEVVPCLPDCLDRRAVTGYQLGVGGSQVLSEGFLPRLADVGQDSRDVDLKSDEANAEKSLIVLDIQLIPLRLQAR